MIGPRRPKQTSADEKRARAVVKERDKGLCVRCGRPGNNFDHRKNRSQGGLWSASNGQTLCGSGTTGCHGYVTQNPMSALRDGYTCPSYARPELWPAYRFDVGWVIYDDDGGWQEISESLAEFLMTGGGRT